VAQVIRQRRPERHPARLATILAGPDSAEDGPRRTFFRKCSAILNRDQSRTVWRDIGPRARANKESNA